MIRILAHQPHPQKVVLSLAGDLSGEAIHSLATELARWQGKIEQVVVDLAHITSIDNAGLQQLQHSDPPLELRRVPRYIWLMLQQQDSRQ